MKWDFLSIEDVSNAMGVSSQEICLLLESGLFPSPVAVRKGWYWPTRKDVIKSNAWHTLDIQAKRLLLEFEKRSYRSWRRNKRIKPMNLEYESVMISWHQDKIEGEKLGGWEHVLMATGN